MKIRRLEIQGFKSFADRTVLRFGEGITGVVGPNGCGKSNIVDAIRWVMGEQSAKHLRGSGMQDVIFAGCESRGPMSLCEVTITFHNDGNLVPPDYQGHDEISVTRRLFRDGTSEYAINKVGCRLRDILDLFMGTGIGKNAYSIIEQGRIGLIVTAKPEDRRAFIEDAAGVSRYKARRKQAERRIAATEQNLLRINDLTEELGQRLKTLKNQAEKAERYKRLKDELKTLDLSVAVQRYLELQARMGFEAQSSSELQLRVDEGETQLTADEAALTERQDDLTARDEALRERENVLHEHRQALALTKNDAAYLEKQQATLTEREEEALTEQTTLQQELVGLKSEHDEANDEGQALDEADDELRMLDNRAAALDNGRAELADTQKKLDAAKQAAIEALSAIAQQKNGLSNLDRTDTETDQQIHRATEARKGAAQRARAAETKATEVFNELERNRQLKLRLDDRRGEQEGLLKQLRDELAEIEGSLQQNQQTLMDRRSRLNSLQAIQRNYEGCTEAVRLLMQRKAHDSSLGLHGLVADVITPEPALEAAVEGLLGERLQHVIVNSQTDAISAIDLLRNHDAGRSSFVPLELREPPRSDIRISSEPPLSNDSNELMEAARRAAPADPIPLTKAGTAPTEGGLPTWDEILEQPSPLGPSPVGPAPVDPSPISASPLGSARGESNEEQPTNLSGLGSHVPSGFAPPSNGAPAPSFGAADLNPSVFAQDASGLSSSTGAGDAAPSMVTELPVPQPVEAEQASQAPSEVAWNEAEPGAWPPSDPDVIGRLTDLVSAQPGYESVARALLGNAVVVENLDAARRLWAEQPVTGAPISFVTRKGEVLDGVGVMTGGSNEGVSAGLLKQKREITELVDTVRRLEAKVSVESERQTTLKHRVVDIESQISSLSQERHREELSIVNLERDLKKLEEESAREGAERDSKAEEVSFLRTRKSDLADKREATLATVAEREAEKERLEAEVETLREQLAAHQTTVQSLQDAVTEVKVQVAANREKRDNSKRNLARIRQRIKDVEARLAKLAEVIEQSRNDAKDVHAKLESAQMKGAQLQAQLTADEGAVAADREQFEGDMETLKADQAKLKNERGTLDKMKSKLGSAVMKVREFQLGQENLVEQVEERYRLDLTTLLVDYHLAAPLKPEDHKRATKLRKQLDNIGPINLTAIEEHAEVSKRHEFLMTQQRDLEEAIGALRSAIRRINKTSKERYVEAFRLVNEKFQQIFPKLFSGGRCALVMVDESDPLESGIEMLAQPPGKKLQSVNLLSGGEKALTAVALIFGIFLIKPTPFCLLDEVDAPLDEANVGRYNEMLREMSSISQFILITHNKRTMELPDRLYGVTMETPGVSKIVPVDVVESQRRLRAV